MLSYLRDKIVQNNFSFITTMKLYLAILIIALINQSKSECPNLDDIPNMYNSNTYMCARFYYGFGHDLAVRGCNGCSISEYYDVPHGQDTTAPDGRQYPFGSIMVKPGCKFYVFHDHNYGGGYDIYEGPAIVSKVYNNKVVEVLLLSYYVLSRYLVGMIQ